ncbi:hypothetical protein Tco_0415542, partial [Tanacetum coccineum]
GVEYNEKEAEFVEAQEEEQEMGQEDDQKVAVAVAKDDSS